jgi:16S rRNA (uracil1498-N3)-methyltransferase
VALLRAPTPLVESSAAVRVPRVYVSRPVVPGDSVALDGAEAHHLVHVLRRGDGDAVEVSGPGGLFAAVVERLVGETESAEAQVELLIGERLPTVPPVPWAIAVAQVKGQGFELAVRQASELGLAAIASLVSERSVVQGVSATKLERWRRIAQEAAKQSGRTPPLKVGEELTFQEALRGSSGAARFIASPGSPWPGLEVFGGARPAVSAPEEPAAFFLIGPEGGFLPGELEAAREAGFCPFGFPTPILRTGTAVAFIAAIGSVVSAGPTDSGPQLTPGPATPPATPP